MAVRNVSMVIHEDGRLTVSWAGLLQSSTDSGSPFIPNGKFTNYSVQATGTFGAGGAVALQGSQDNVNWATLDDESGTAVSLVAATKVWRVSNLPRYVRPLVTGGDGTTNLAVVVSGHQS